MLDWFVGFFSNVFNIVMMLIFVLVGILIGIILFRMLTRPKNQILYCRERDGRGLELNISEEDAVSMVTSSDPQLRFYKYGRAYNFFKRARNFARFFGKEGTGLTWRLLGFGGSAKKPKKIDLEFDSLEEVVKHKWGSDFYGTVPEAMQQKLQDNRLLVTVGLEPGITPKGYTPITEDIIEDKADKDMAKLFGEAAKQGTTQSIIQVLPWIGAGSALTFVGLLLLGVIG